MQEFAEIIEWLKGLEQSAARFYDDVAHQYRQDAPFAAFLFDLARDEEWHVKVMERAADLARAGELPKPQISLEEPFRKRVEQALGSCRLMLSENPPTDRLLGCIIDAEYSEWNDIFYYVVNVLKERSRTFEEAASKMQQHRKHMERFLERYPSGSALLGKIRKLPSLWQERVLLIEDYMPIRRVLADLLSQHASITTAVNGQEGLDRLRESHYDVVISDIDMPIMDGYDFYREAARIGQDLNDRILFLAANPFEARITALAEKGLPFFAKPVPILQFEERVLSIIRKTRRSEGAEGSRT